MGVTPSAASSPPVVISDLVQKTLEGVNKLRNAVGLGSLKYMPQGYTGDGSNCPIARAVKEIFDDHGELGVDGADLGTLYSKDDAAFIKVLRESGVADLTESDDLENWDGNTRVHVRISPDYSGTFDQFVRKFDEGEIAKLIDKE